MATPLTWIGILVCLSQSALPLGLNLGPFSLSKLELRVEARSGDVHALLLVARLAPVLQAYQVLLYPVAKPSALVRDAWLGGEEIRYYRERDLRRLIRLHRAVEGSDIGQFEGQGALNLLDIDDVPLADEGEPIDPRSVVRLPFDGDQPVYPAIGVSADDRFLQTVDRSGKRWVVIVDETDTPRMVLGAHDFLREALFAPERG